MEKLKFKAFRDKKSGKWLHNYNRELFYPSDAPQLLRPTISIKEIKIVQKNNSLIGLMPKGKEGVDFELVDIELIVKFKKPF